MPAGAFADGITRRARSSRPLADTRVSASGRGERCRTRVDAGPRPGDGDDRPARAGAGAGDGPSAALAKTMRGAAALEQGLGDEEARAPCRRSRDARRAGVALAHEGVADPADQLGRIAGTVVADPEPELRRVPVEVDPDRRRREVDGVLHEVAQPLHDLRAARHRRLAARRPLDAGDHLDAAVGVRRRRLLDDAREGREAHQRVLLALRSHRPQDLGAAVGLVADQRGVLLQRRLPGELVDELGGGELDRRQRRAELVRRRGDDAAERRELLLARERHLRRGERLAHREGLVRHPPRVDREEGGADDQRGPGAGGEHRAAPRAPRPTRGCSGTE